MRSSALTLFLILSGTLVLGAPLLDDQPSEDKPQATNNTSTDTQTQDSTDVPSDFSSLDTSTFSCKGKTLGYYADVKLQCKVYHFCTPMEGIEQTTYTRMSYICLDGSVFDQKDLNCVDEKDLKVPCSKAESEYEKSNKQFDHKEESQPSMSDNLAANLMMNPITRFIAG